MMPPLDLDLLDHLYRSYGWTTTEAYRRMHHAWTYLLQAAMERLPFADPESIDNDQEDIVRYVTLLGLTAVPVPVWMVIMDYRQRHASQGPATVQ